MACRCEERAQALRRIVSAGVHGDLRTVSRDAGDVARSLREDLRSGELRRELSMRVRARLAGRT